MNRRGTRGHVAFGALWLVTTGAAQAQAPSATAAASAASASSAAPSASAPQVLPAVTVTATRSERAAHDVPASITRVDVQAADDARMGVQIADVLQGVPGLVARHRQNYAQDVQISVRGYGTRASFGIRGVRVYVDGVPATLPDGQGQVTHVDLASAERIEVLRGPYSALWGNASGGVILVDTAEGHGPASVTLGLARGSFDSTRTGLVAQGGSDRLGWIASASRYETDGSRAHGAARRDLLNGKLAWRPVEGTTVTWTANHVNVPLAQDPLGLSRAAFDADPHGADPAAFAFDTRKTYRQTQTGVVVEQRLADTQTLRALLYAGTRRTEQFQAIPVAAQAPPTHPGGVIDLGRRYRGADLRWTWRPTVAGQAATLIAGYAWDRLDEDRRGWQNFVPNADGEPGNTLGVRGALRRDERNTASSGDPYLQGTLALGPRWWLEAGVRRATVRFASQDRYVVPGNPDDSGRGAYRATLPLAAVRFAATADLSLYLSAGRGFETPTLNELAYRPGGETGLNLALRPATSRSLEAGAKWRNMGWGDLTVAVFETGTRDEIVTATNVGGRATFQNAGRTRRTGAEVGWAWQGAGAWRANAALTWLDARYRDDFAVCTSTPCTGAGTTVPAGNRLPGVARESASLAFAWRPERGWRWGVDGRASGRVPVNDPNSDAASGYAVLGGHLGYARRAGPFDLALFLRVDNALDRRYAGSVIVGEGNGRWFEAAPGRNWTLGLDLTYGR